MPGYNKIVGLQRPRWQIWMKCYSMVCTSNRNQNIVHSEHWPQFLALSLLSFRGYPPSILYAEKLIYFCSCFFPIR